MTLIISTETLLYDGDPTWNVNFWCRLMAGPCFNNKHHNIRILSEAIETLSAYGDVRCR